MKKILAIILVISGISTGAFAQHQGSAEFGVNIGLNTSTIQDASGYNADYKTGVNFGVSGEYYFSNSWSIKAKAIYDQKGWGNGVLFLPDGSEIDGVDYRLNYITVPVMADWHFGRRRNWYLNFGPYVGFLTNASETSNSADVNPLFNTTDVGIAFGIGVKIPISNTANVFFEYDGQGGLTNISSPLNSGDTYQNIRNSFNVGFSFPLR
ncbi:MAG TPA: porin family protein [Mucilaginibacter sp.]|nr:porin family protein [Mucilaginibacter sp.]